MEGIQIDGIISLYEYPVHWSDEEFRYWWCPETDELGHIIRPARMSEGEKRSRQIRMDDGRWYAKNLITNTGISLLLTNMSVTGQGSMNPFAQILSVGNGATTGVTRADAAVIGDGFTTGARKAPASYTVTGFTTTIVTNYASGDAVGTLTNIGLYGYNTGGAQSATTSTGTGSLMSHALFAFTKGASAVAVNYVFVLSN